MVRGWCNIELYDWWSGLGYVVCGFTCKGVLGVAFGELITILSRIRSSKWELVSGLQMVRL